MKKLLLTASVAALLSAAANATPFDFTEALGSYTVTGSFDGTANGNLITGLSDVSIFVNGVAFVGNGSLHALSWLNFTGNLNAPDDAVLSFDGSANDFIFVDSGPSNFFHGATGQGDAAFNYNIGVFAFGSADSHMIITDARDTGGGSGGSVPEPASWALMLCGFGAIGGAMRARRKTMVSFT